MFRFSTFIMTVLLVSAARADDITGPSHIESVTVFPDQAQVTRAIKVTLGQGDQTLVISDLPIGIDTNSVRIEATGVADIQIGSVDLRKVTPPPAVPLLDTDANQRIEALQAERGELDDTIAAAEAKRRLIERLGTASTDGFLKGVGEGKASTDQMKEAWVAFGDGLSSTLSAIRVAHTRQHAIDDEIARIKGAIEHLPNPQHPHNEARVALTTSGSGDATFRLTYRMRGAGWQPVYDARLALNPAGGKPTIDLTLRALVSQATGEDWRDADLTLSTARPSLGTAAPDLKPSVVRIWQPAPQVATTMMAPAPPLADAARPAPASKALRGAADGANADQLKPADELTAEVQTNGLTTVYHVPGRVTVETGAGQRNLKIGGSTLEARLSVKATPKQVANAYLTAEFHSDGDAALLPGKVSIYRGGEFVGTGQIPFVAAGDTVKLGFGEDDKIKVERIALKQTEGDTGIFGSTHQETHDFKIRLKNLHDQVMPVTVEDQIPVSEATEITIDRLATTTQPTKVNADDRRGVLSWSFDLKPNEEKEIRVGWRMKYPTDRQINLVSVDH